MADISGFFISHVAGLQINPHKDNPAFVRVAPSFIDTLDNASAYYDTVSGTVRVKWERNGEDILLTVEKQDGVSGEVVLPKGYIFTEKTSCGKDWINDRRIYALENAVYTVRRK